MQFGRVASIAVHKIDSKYQGRKAMRPALRTTYRPMRRPFFAEVTIMNGAKAILRAAETLGDPARDRHFKLFMLVGLHHQQNP